MYKPVESIEVHIWNKRVGALRMDPKLGYYVFSYDKSFARLGIELSPIHMPTSPDTLFVFAYLPAETYYRLPAMLADALPDKFGNDLIDAYMAQHGIDPQEITPLDRLAYMGKRGMGALEFKPVRGSIKDSHTAIDMSKLVESARKVIYGGIDTALMAKTALNQIIQVGSSAGGARAKAVVAWNPKTNEIRAGQFDVSPGFEHWLLKFDGLGEDKGLGKTENHGRIEYAYYQMALQAGINMSPCRLLEEHGRAHFMTKRFDRDGNKKHHIQTLCAMGHMDFKQLSTYSYNQLFMVIDQLGLGYDDKEEVFRRMAFNVMSANCDDHTKNIAFMLEEGKDWKLAPPYDLTFAHNPIGKWTYQHFMSVDGKFRDITLNDMLAIAERFSIGKAQTILKQVKAAVLTWPELALENGVTEKETEEIRRHQHIF